MESSKNQPEPEKLYIRPADKSLAAYKGFILDMQEHLTGNRNDSMSEEEWVDSWREFWEGGI
ncbi:MAG: hypothetical protein PHX97_05960 [Dehalococcoidales bacterium]|jgi:hypothetical protein|nr:hypothetical protein [Dehalococcoidales bacterium]MDD5122906.1 hypothetical protein [Dehalococcoidales bacterium]MDD5499087.1 hypothetical protein [Dehalococcoidales bacterium]